MLLAPGWLLSEVEGRGTVCQSVLGTDLCTNDIGLYNSANFLFYDLPCTPYSGHIQKQNQVGMDVSWSKKFNMKKKIALKCSELKPT
jgi:hypothetical protein